MSNTTAKITMPTMSQSSAQADQLNTQTGKVFNYKYNNQTPYQITLALAKTYAALARSSRSVVYLKSAKRCLALLGELDKLDKAA